MSNITTTEYGEVSNATILKIFGDEMTYNELKFYAKDKDNTTHLAVEINTNGETQLVRVYLDGEEVMDKKYSIHHSCDMFHFLNELECEKVESEPEPEPEPEPVVAKKKIKLVIKRATKPKKEKSVDWIHAFTVDEDILVYCKDDRNRNIWRKAKVSKINKASISVRLYMYNEIDDLNAIRNQTHGYNRLIWTDLGKKIHVIRASAKNCNSIGLGSFNTVARKGQYKMRDDDFIEGKRFVDYGN